MIFSKKISSKQQISFILLLIIIVFLSGCITQKEKTYKIGILCGVDAFTSVADGFKSKMTELGYIEGENVIYDFQKAGGDVDKMNEISRKFVTDEVDLILTITHGAASIAKTETKGTGIPVVFTIAQVEGSNLVESRHMPGGNITGVRFPGADLTVKRFEFLIEMVPKAKTIWLTYKLNYPSVAPALDELRQIASLQNVTLIEVPVTNVEDIAIDLEIRSKNEVGFDAILIMPEPLSQTAAGWKLISDFASENNLPIAGSADFEAEEGAIFSYNFKNIEAGELAAPLVHKIFMGTSAGTIPVVTPESHLRINYKLTKDLGLNVSDSLLNLADDIIT